MSARTGLWMLIAASVLAMGFAVFHGAPQQPPKPVKARAQERPWLTHEAMQQLVSPGGGPGPLFASLTLGGTPPDAATRHAVEAFALENAIEIRFEVADDELKAIRVGVTFGGCCGYEGADTLGRQLHRTIIYTGCCDQCNGNPADDWNSTSDEGINIHGHVAVNRIDVRWEAMLTLPEVLDRAEALVGRPRATVRAHAGDRWHELWRDELIDVPYEHGVDEYPAYRGLTVAVEHGRIVDVSFGIRDVSIAELGATLRKRWGRPHVAADQTLTWRTSDRVITVEPVGDSATFAIHATAPATTTALARVALTPAPRS